MRRDSLFENGNRWRKYIEDPVKEWSKLGLQIETAIELFWANSRQGEGKLCLIPRKSVWFFGQNETALNVKLVDAGRIAQCDLDPHNFWMLYMSIKNLTVVFTHSRFPKEVLFISKSYL